LIKSGLQHTAGFSRVSRKPAGRKELYGILPKRVTSNKYDMIDIINRLVDNPEFEPTKTVTDKQSSPVMHASTAGQWELPTNEK
jgi:acetyl-CoA carboxylase carboxyltransferase component